MPTVQEQKTIDEKTSPIIVNVLLDAGELADALKAMYPNHSTQYLYRHILHQVIIDLQKEVVNVD